MGYQISRYGGQIHFIKGKNNVQADFLSRLAPRNIPKYKDHSKIESKINDVALVNLDKVDLSCENKWDTEIQTDPIKPGVDLEMNKLQLEDRHLKAIIDNLKEKGEKSKYYRRYIVLDNVLYYVTSNEELRIVVPSAIQSKIIEETHAGSSGSHIGRDRTFDMLRRRYFWKGLSRQVYDYVSKCDKCNQQNLVAQNAPLQETPIAQYPFQRISIDTCGPYPITENDNRFCVTVTDQFSGWVEVFPVPDKRATTIARILIDQVFSRHSWSRFMTSDNGTEFINEIIKSITEMGHINHIKTSIYHPQSNTYAERPHRTMVDCLAKVSHKDDWDVYVPSFTAAYNSSVSAGRKYSPFFLLYHRDPTVPLDTLLRDRGHYYGSDFFPAALETMHEAYHIVRKRIKYNNQRNRDYYNKNKKKVQFEVGDPVYLRKFIRDGKLDSKWEPHFRVIVKTGPTSFTVQNQLTGITKRVHANDIRHAKMSDLGEVDPTVDHESDDSDDETIVYGDNTDVESELSDEECFERKSTKSDSDEQQATETNRPTRGAKRDAIAKMQAVNAVSDQSIDDIIKDKMSKLFLSFADQLQ